MTYIQVGTALKTIMDSLTDLQSVYDYEPDELEKFPALTIQAAGHEGEFRSTAHNMREHRFIMRLYLPTISGRAQQAEADMRFLLDTIVATIDSNPTLNGACSFATPSAGRIQPADREMPVSVAEIDVVAKSFVRRNP